LSGRAIPAGLAFDFCVHYSAEDAHRKEFIVFVVEDGCRGIDVDGSAAVTWESLAALSVPCIVSSALA
jgi:nicotinamidase/pyrazinamidase